LFGAFSPLNGHQFSLELPQCNSISFQIYLEEFAKEYPEELKIIVLDNGAFHKAKKLKIPNNIGLLFLPPYSPELNPAEKIWAKFKRDFTNRLFYSLDDLRDFVCQLINKLTVDEVISICSFDYIFSSNYWTNV
jgi:transposase